jgi:hypothetical protein
MTLALITGWLIACAAGGLWQTIALVRWLQLRGVDDVELEHAGAGDVVGGAQ